MKEKRLYNALDDLVNDPVIKRMYETAEFGPSSRDRYEEAVAALKEAEVPAPK